MEKRGINMIREATHADMPKLLKMAESFYGLLPFKEPFNEESVYNSISNMIDSEAGALFTDEEARCMLGAIVYPAWMNHDVLIASEMLWWSENPRASTKLLKSFEEWGINKGASYFHMIRLESNEPNRLDDLYQRKGYRALEHVYFKEV